MQAINKFYKLIAVLVGGLFISMNISAQGTTATGTMSQSPAKYGGTAPATGGAAAMPASQNIYSSFGYGGQTQTTVPATQTTSTGTIPTKCEIIVNTVVPPKQGWHVVVQDGITTRTCYQFKDGQKIGGPLPPEECLHLPDVMKCEIGHNPGLLTFGHCPIGTGFSYHPPAETGTPMACQCLESYNGFVIKNFDQYKNICNFTEPDTECLTSAATNLGYQIAAIRAKVQEAIDNKEEGKKAYYEGVLRNLRKSYEELTNSATNIKQNLTAIKGTLNNQSDTSGYKTYAQALQNKIDEIEAKYGGLNTYIKKLRAISSPTESEKKHIDAMESLYQNLYKTPMDKLLASKTSVGSLQTSFQRCIEKVDQAIKKPELVSLQHVTFSGTKKLTPLTTGPTQAPVTNEQLQGLLAGLRDLIAKLP